MASVDIAKMDRNFLVDTTVQREDMEYHDPRKAPLALYGIFYQNSTYRRMPENVAKSVSDWIEIQHKYSAGGRVRFITDSPYVAIYVKFGRVCKLSHFPLTGSAGFDLYQDGIYKKTFVPPYSMEEGFESIYDIPNFGR